MPRESRAIPKYGGSETEYGIGSLDMPRLSPSECAWRFVTRIKPKWIPGGCFSSWDSRPRLAEGKNADHEYLTESKWRKANILLPNGSRLYYDSSHPELSTALCRTPKEKLAYYKASDCFMQQLVEKHREEGLNVYLVKNNYGFDDISGSERFADATLDALLNSTVSFSHHDNYLFRRDVVLEYLVEYTIPWLVSRQILNGQGKVGCHNRRINGLPWCDFQISQRADFFGTSIGNDTMSPQRPIFNTRDVPYADQALYRRLHMITADHNMCETAYFLTIALTEIHFMMIEDGFLDRRFIMTDPVKAFWQISRDLTLQQPISLSGRKSRSPLDLLEEEVTRMGEYLVLYGIQNPEYHEAVALGLSVIRKLRKNIFYCIGMLDWPSKLAVIRDRINKGKTSSVFSSEWIQLDIGYSKIDPRKSIFWVSPLIQRKHKKNRIISDAAIEAATHMPPPTRSALQVAVMKLFSGNVSQWNWSEITILVPEENAEYEINLGNPLMTEAEYAPLVACANRQEFLRAAHEAGIAKKYEKKYAEPARPWAPICPEDD